MTITRVVDVQFVRRRKLLGSGVSESPVSDRLRTIRHAVILHCHRIVVCGRKFNCAVMEVFIGMVLQRTVVIRVHDVSRHKSPILIPVDFCLSLLLDSLGPVTVEMDLIFDCSHTSLRNAVRHRSVQ